MPTVQYAPPQGWKKMFCGLTLVCCLASAAIAEEIIPPSGVNMPRLQLLERPDSSNQNSKLKLYVVISGKKSDGKTFLSSKELLNRFEVEDFRNLLMNRIKETERFEVYDQATTEVMDQSSIVVEGRVLSTMQHMENMVVVRKAISKVRLSVQIKETETGLLVKAKTFTGVHGTNPGEGTKIVSDTEIGTSALQESLFSDLEAALNDAVEEAANYIESRYRPVGKISVVQDKAFSMDGGEMHGFKEDDEVVVFRTTFHNQNGVRVPGLITGVAVAQCKTVQTHTSTCHVKKTGDAGSIQKDDYVLLSDVSLMTKQ